MTQEQLQENIEDNTVRLQRQYEICQTGYNRPALKDLAHVLRIWMDMSNEVNAYIKQHKPKHKFTSFSILPIFNRAFRNNGCIVTAFPNGITLPTLVETDEEGLPRHVLVAADTTNLKPYNMVVNIRTTPLDNGTDRVEHLVSVWNQEANTKFTKQEHDIIDGRIFELKRVFFDSWLSSVVIKFNMNSENGELIRHNLSRENIIRRVANILGGSHPEGAWEASRFEDAAVKELMNTRVLDLPIPYLVLMTIARDIINVFS